VIGAYTFATVAAFLDVLGIVDHNAAKAWWIALVVGLVLTVPTALTGLADWLRIQWGSALWRTATMHLTAMVTATVFFLIAAIVGHDPYTAGNVTTGPFVLTLIGFVALTAGGWLGGAITYVHGMRVLSLTDEPAARAAAPVPHEEKVEAAS
jgi:uncharacterized membrane protein